jgi:hypothetical protein
MSRSYIFPWVPITLGTTRIRKCRSNYERPNVLHGIVLTLDSVLIATYPVASATLFYSEYISKDFRSLTLLAQSHDHSGVQQQTSQTQQQSTLGSLRRSANTSSLSECRASKDCIESTLQDSGGASRRATHNPRTAGSKGVPDCWLGSSHALPMLCLWAFSHSCRRRGERRSYSPVGNG